METGFHVQLRGFGHKQNTGLWRDFKDVPGAFDLCS